MLTGEWQIVGFKFTADEADTLVRTPMHFSQEANEGTTIYIDGLAIIGPVAAEDTTPAAPIIPGANFTFDEAADADAWDAPEDLALSVNTDLGALVASPTWSGNLRMDATFDTPVANLLGGTVSTYIYVPEAYATEAQINLQYRFADDSGGQCFIGYSRPAPDTGDDWYLLSVSPATDAATDCGYTDGDFDFTNITTIGIEFVAGTTEVTEDFLIDNVTIIEPQTAMFSFNEAADVDAWSGPAELVLSYDAASKSMKAVPTWTDVDTALQVDTTLDTPIADLTGATVSSWVYIPETYTTDGGLRVQYRFGDGGGGQCFIGYSLPAADSGDAWYNLSVTPTAAGDCGYSDGGFDLTNITTISIQFTAAGAKEPEVTGDFFIDNISVSLP